MNAKLSRQPWLILVRSVLAGLQFRRLGEEGQGTTGRNLESFYMCHRVRALIEITLSIGCAWCPFASPKIRGYRGKIRVI